MVSSKPGHVVAVAVGIPVLGFGAVADASSIRLRSGKASTEQYPDDTLPPLQAAFEAGADRLELDVHAAADGDRVVRHPLPARDSHQRWMGTTATSTAGSRIPTICPR